MFRATEMQLLRLFSVADFRSDLTATIALVHTESLQSLTSLAFLQRRHAGSVVLDHEHHVYTRAKLHCAASFALPVCDRFEHGMSRFAVCHVFVTSRDLLTCAVA